MDFQLYFQNVIWPGGIHFFIKIFFWKCQTPQNVPKYWWWRGWNLIASRPYYHPPPTMCGKLSELHCKATLVSNRGEKVMKWRKTLGPIVFLAIQTFSPGMENKEPSKCGSESFPRMMTYILCVENCQSYILPQSCLPITGRLFYNVRKFWGPRILECNIPNYIPKLFSEHFDQ